MKLALLLTAFGGRWIGETVGCESPAHIWEIEQRGDRLWIESRWEGETAVARMLGILIADQLAFAIGTQTATLLDSQHFVIPNWDTNDRRGGGGPAYDVIFSRPGLAELTARDVYTGWRARQLP
jgi:hypothetical protein